MDSSGRGRWDIRGDKKTLQKGIEEINKTDRAKIDADKHVGLASWEVKMKEAEAAREEKLKRVEAEREEKLLGLDTSREVRLAEIDAARETKLKMMELSVEKEYELQSQKVGAFKDIYKTALSDNRATRSEDHAERMKELEIKGAMLTKNGLKSTKMKNSQLRHSKRDNYSVDSTIGGNLGGALSITNHASPMSAGLSGYGQSSTMALGFNGAGGGYGSSGALPLQHSPGYGAGGNSGSSQLGYKTDYGGNSSGCGSEYSRSSYSGRRSVSDESDDDVVDLNYDNDVQKDMHQMSLNHDLEMKRLHNEDNASMKEVNLQKLKLKEMEMKMKMMEMEMKERQERGQQN